MTWDYVYSVEQTSPVQVGGPVPNSSIVTCGLDCVAPMTLPTVADACGNPIAAPAPIVGGTYTGGCDER